MTQPATTDREASGRFVLRLPKTLHAELAEAAEREGVSLNQYATGALAASVGWRKRTRPDHH